MQPDLSAKNLNVTSLISVGQHPKSGRARRAEQDARAVELGLNLSGDQLEMLHVGAGDEAVMRSYLGMGLPKMTLLKQDDSADAVPVLCDYLASHAPDILLTGVRAESGEASGMLPFLLAEKLGWPLVSRIAEIGDVNDGVAEVLQALPRGQRRAIKVRLPFVASVDNAAAEPRQSAFGPGQRAGINDMPVAGDVDAVRSGWEESPARKKPKRLKVVKAKTAADRFKAATAKASGGGGKVLKKESPAEQAQAVLDLLIEEGVVR